MNRIADLVVKNADKAFRATALIVDQTVVLSTPVDTGRARSNWIVQSQFPSREVRNAYSPGKEGATGSTNAQRAIAQARAVINSDQSGVIWISNNLSYIDNLNQGSSAQAPAGFVEASVEAGRQELRRVSLLRGA